MKKLCVILLCFFAVHSIYAVERWAFVIGIGEYPADSGWNKINGDKDIEIIVPMLRKLGFRQENIITLKNQSATKHNIKEAVYKTLIPKLHNGDIVYFHFSGHGQLITDLDGDEDGSKSEGWDEAMIPFDAMSKYNANGYKGENHLVDDELNEWLMDIREKIGNTGKILVALDACHSGGASRGENDEDEENESVRGTNDKFRIPLPPDKKTRIEKRPIDWVCISACQYDQRNYEYKSANGDTYGRLSWALSNVLSSDKRAAELEALINNQYELLPETPSGQDVHIDYNADLTDKTVL